MKAWFWVLALGALVIQAKARVESAVIPPNAGSAAIATPSAVAAPQASAATPPAATAPIPNRASLQNVPAPAIYTQAVNLAAGAVSATFRFAGLSR